MTVATFLRILFAVVSLLAASLGAAHAADVAEVFIDGRDPAFVVVQGVAADAPPLARQEMASYATLDNVSLVPWDAFRQEAEVLLKPHILKDEYPGAALALNIVALVKAYPGRPFAVTWNGGLAASFQDYQHAVSTYRAFQENAEGYERARPADPRLDPLNPANHLPGLLNP